MPVNRMAALNDNTNRPGKPMRSYHHVANELAHISAMVAQLEHLIQDTGTGQENPVTSLDYWRARIQAVLDAELPPPLEPQVRVLRARLDALGAARSPTRSNRRES